jgi:hypothetical protein
VGTALIAGQLEQVADNRSRYQLAQAKTSFLTAKVKQDNAYNNDEDYASIPTRYENTMRSAISDASQLIDDSRVRAMFQDDSELQSLKGFERISSFARGVETDYQRAYVSDGLKKIRESALTGDVSDSMAAASELVDSAVAMNYLSAEEGESAISAWTDDTLVSKIKMMEPEERVNSLNQEWASSIPSDLRVGLQRESDAMLLDSRAMGFVDELMIQGKGDEYSMGQINLIPDPDLRAAAESRYKTEIGTRRTLSAENDTDDMNQYYAMLRDPANASAGPGERFTYDSIPEDVRNQFSANTVASLRAAEAQGVSATAPRTDYLVQQALHDAARLADRSKDYTQFRELLNLSRGSLSAGDNNRWSEVASAGVEGLDPVVESYLNDQQYVIARLTDQLGSVKPSDRGRKEEVNDLVLRWDTHRNNYQNSNKGEVPSPAMRQDFMDIFLEERAFKKPALFGWMETNVRSDFVSMSPGDKSAFLDTLQASDEGRFSAVLNLMGVEKLQDIDEADYGDILTLWETK